jgi:glycosyltransferase involved in cell wall biosynthesis
VVVEALACGTPVLVSEMVGAKDLVEEGVNGWVVPIGDVAALAERMRWCADNADVVRAMRPATRRSAQPATWESYHRRLVAFLNRQLGGGSGARATASPLHGALA